MNFGIGYRYGFIFLQEDYMLFSYLHFRSKLKKLTYMVLFLFYSCNPEVLIITHSYNRPDFIKLQAKAFRTFLEDDYRFVVFNDACDHNISSQISNVCKELEIECVRIPQRIHDLPYLPITPGPHNQNNRRHVNCIQYSLDKLGFNHKGIVVILDSDMFLIRPFSIEKYMADHDIAALIRRSPLGEPPRCFYFCPVLSFFRMDTLPNVRSMNFNCGMINGTIVDSGGYIHYYWVENPNIKVKQINVLYSHELYLADTHINKQADTSISQAEKIICYQFLGFKNNEINFLLKCPSTFEFYLDQYFIHFRGGSTTALKDFKKFQLFCEMIDEAIQRNQS